MTMAQWCRSIGRRMMSNYRMPMPIPTSSSSSSSSWAPKSSASAPVLCGRGDKKTKKGKRFKGTYGNARPKKKEMIERIKDKNEVPRSTPWPLPFKLI